MSKLRFYAAALTIGALTGLSSAQADDTTAKAGQQANRSQNDQVDRSEAQRDSHAANKQQQGPTVKEALVRKLIKANDAEIEIAKLAQKKTDNQDIQQLAKMIVQDHEALNQTLQPHAGKRSANSQSEVKRQQGRKGLNSLADQDQSQAGVRQADEKRNGTEQSNIRRISEERADADRKGIVQKDTDRIDGDLSSEGNLTRTDSAIVPQQLCKIGEQACDNALKMTNDMLNKIVFCQSP